MEMEQRHESNNSDKDESPVLPCGIGQLSSHPTAQQATTLRLIDVCEDCMLKIFEWLTLTDLGSLAETCTRFQEILQRAFPKNLRIKYRFDGDGHCDVESRKYLRSESRPSRDIVRVLRSFGSLLSEVEILPIRRRTQSDFMLSLVADHCVDSLESLTCFDAELSAAVTEKLKPIFKRLKRLHLIRSKIVDGKTLFADFGSLIDLRVQRVTNCIAIFENIFPKLKRFGYSGNDQVDQHVPTFVLRHTNLKSLDLDAHIPDENRQTALLQAISNSCMELEELKLNFRGRTNSSSLQLLQELQSLKTLQLGYVRFEDYQFLAALAHLTTLHLIGGNADVVDTVRQLTNLEDLTINSGAFPSVLDEGKFAEIVALVHGRPKLLTLKCKFNFVLNSKSCYQKGNVRLVRLDRRDS